MDAIKIEESRDWYTTPQLALKVGLSRKTIWAWADSGKLKSHRVGAQYRITETDWQDFVAKCNPVHKKAHS